MGIVKADHLEAVLEAFDRVTVRVDAVPGKGRGVFAVRAIRKGEIIETVPVLVIPAPQVDDLEKTLLDHYVYSWPDERLAVALGYGSLYNHSYTPNALYVKHPATSTIDYVALADIDAGAEITVNYNGTPTDRAPVWFDVR